MTPPVDFMGREIMPGDTLVYPVRRGASMWLRRLLVTQALETSVTGTNPDGRCTTIKNLGTSIVVAPNHPVM